MKLVKQTNLYFQNEKSDKVYEVDLCEVGENEYVVNFRYGRRGANLKDGSKTPLPETYEKAQIIFDKLVDSKIKKGYQILDEHQNLGPVKKVNHKNTAKTKTYDSNSHAQKLFAKFESLINQPHHEELNRKIWRMGELELKEAIPHLIKLLHSKDDFRDYCILHSLGFCAKPPNQEVSDAADKIYNSFSATPYIKRMALELILKIGSDELKEKYQKSINDSIAQKIEQYKDGSTFELTGVFNENKVENYEVLYLLYLSESDNYRELLIKLLKNIPFEPGYFRQIRYIFKASLFRKDYEVFGLLSYRFEKEKSFFTRDPWGFWDPKTNRWLEDEDLTDILKSDKSHLAFSKQTKTYFKKKIWREMKKLGDLNRNEYVDMAISHLKYFSDEDMVIPPRFDEYCQQKLSYFWAFNHILYRNSRRFEYKYGNWYFKEGVNAGTRTPDKREEAYPHLWNKSLSKIFNLLKESHCLPVHEFGVKVILDHPEYLNTISKTDVIILLGSPYEITANLGFECSKKLLDENPLDFELLSALVNCAYEKARSHTLQFIALQKEKVVKNIDFIMSLLTSNYKDTRDFSKSLFNSTQLEDSLKNTLFQKMLSYLINAKENTDIIIDMVNLCSDFFESCYKELTGDFILNILEHPLEEIKVLGAKIIVKHPKFTHNPDKNIIEKLLNSPIERLQVMGVKLFILQDSKTILEQKVFLVQLMSHEKTAMSDAVKPVLKEILKNEEQANEIFSLLIHKLIQFKKEERINQIMKIIKDDFSSLKKISVKLIFKLLRAPSLMVKELGGIYLSQYENLSFLQFDQIVELANNDVLFVRELSFKHCEKNHHLIKDNIEGITRLLDSNWNDSRDFYFDFIKSNLKEEDFSPKALVNICDSVNEKVSAFGRELITRFFKKEDGSIYLIRLSEHPSQNMQLYVTNYLNQYASNDLDKIQKLLPYFKGILCKVNKGRIAKERVLTFLEKEGLKSAESAKLIKDILIFASPTLLIQDKNRIIHLMVKIKNQYPEIDFPIKMKEIEVRNAL